MLRCTIKILLVTIFLVHLSVHVVAAAHYHTNGSLFSDHASFSLHDVDHNHVHVDLSVGIPPDYDFLISPPISYQQVPFSSPTFFVSNHSLAPSSSRAPPAV